MVETQKRGGGTKRRSSRPPSGEPGATPGIDMSRILDRVNDGLIVLDREFRYRFVNARAGELLGRPPDELLGRGYYELFPEAAGTPFERAYGRAMAEQVALVIEDWYEPWDRWFENRIYPTGDGIAILFTEITERKRLERRLTFQAEALANVNDAVVAVDARQRVVLWNRAAERQYGYSAEEAFGRSYGELVGSPLSDADRAEIFRSIETDGTWVGEVRHHDRSGRPIDLEVRTSGAILPDGSPAYVAVLHDISERTRAARQASFQEAVLANVGDAIVAVDADDRILYWNAQAERQYGYTAEEAVGRPYNEVTGSTFDPARQPEVLATLEATGSWSGDVVHHDREGHPIEIEVREIGRAHV